MRFRAVHFACVMVLLSTFGAADAYASPGARFTAQRIAIILQQGSANATQALAPGKLADTPQASQRSAYASPTQAAWQMRPPAAHTVAQHAVTGSGL